MCFFRAIKLISFLCFGCSLLFGNSNAVFAHARQNGDRYYGYIGLGTGFGGFYAEPRVGFIVNAAEMTRDLKIGNGLAVGGFTGLIQAQAGVEWRFVNHLYLAVEANGNVALNQQSQYATTGSIVDGVMTGSIEIESARAIGSNAFGGAYVATKIGWTDSGDAFSGYVLLGVGYESMPNNLTASDKTTTQLTDGTNVENIDIETRARYSLELGGPRLQYGLGCSYYFNENFGLYLNFVMTSPIAKGSLSLDSLSIITGGSESSTTSDLMNPKLVGDFASFSYFANLGLVVRF